jgi:aspartate racemase
LISHADVGRVLNDVGDNNIAGLARYLAQLIEELSRAGADVAAIAAITPHICMPQLLKRSSLPLINLVEEVARAVRSKELSRVAIFGTRFSVETGLFGQLDGVEIVRPKPDELDLIHNSYLQIVDAGCGSDEIFRVLRNLAHRLCERDGAEAIILAGTELSLVFNQANTDFPAIDCARIHIDAIMNQVLR